MSGHHVHADARQRSRQPLVLATQVVAAIVVVSAIVLAVWLSASDDVPVVSDPPRPDDLEQFDAPVRAAFEQAIKAYRTTPGPKSMRHLARTYHANGEYPLAVQCYEAAVIVDAGDARTFHLLGLLYESTGDHAAAWMFDRAIALAPDYAPAHYRLGRVLLDRGDAADAVNAFEAAIALEPDRASYLAGLGAALRQSGALERAADVLQQALAIDADHPAAHQLLGLTLQALDRSDEARRHLERVQRRSSEVVADPWLGEVHALAVSFDVLLSRAEILVDGGRHRSALTALDRVDAMYPDRAGVHALRARAHLGIGDDQSAINALVRATRLDPADGDSRALLAMLLVHHNILDGAQRELDAALRIAPDNPYAIAARGGLAVRRGAFDEAVTILEPLVDRRGDLVPPHVWLGDALIGLERWNDAADSFRRALELQPSLEMARQRLALIAEREAPP